MNEEEVVAPFYARRLQACARALGSKLLYRVLTTQDALKPYAPPQDGSGASSTCAPTVAQVRC